TTIKPNQGRSLPFFRRTEDRFYSNTYWKSMTEQRAEIAPDEASDAGVLLPVKADNEVWHDLCRCESVISIRY
ncbi:MAG: hypothetical protein IKN89_04550, partial [Oscillospiraceae bacterium]|nr:hypothetical protein [Oscillospiraceae bacterium]